MLQDHNVGTVGEVCSQRFARKNWNDRQSHLDLEVIGHVEQHCERRMRFGRVVIAPPQRQHSLRFHPCIQFARESVPIHAHHLERRGGRRERHA